MAVQIPGPKFIMGDLNASVEHLPHLKQEIEDGWNFYLGGICSKYGSPENIPTCQVSGERTQSRHDCTLANKDAENR